MGQEFGAPAPPKSGMPVWAWLIIVPCGCMILGVPILAALLFPVFFQAREKARTASCASNIRQLGLATRMYSADYDDYLPPAGAWMGQMVPYTKNNALFHCPSVQPLTSETFGYAFNKELSLRSTAKISSPEKMTMLYDSSNLSWNANDALTSLPNPPRHVYGNNRGYLDGHVKFDRQKSAVE